MRRRDFVKFVATSAGTTMLSSCGRSPRHAGRAAGRRVLVVAFDGMDPKIVTSLMQAGRLPNFARLAARGSFTSLGTSTPPHTPVAFSSIISGADPGLHQVFDFIHRDPAPADASAAIRPFFSTAEAVAPESQWAISLGNWQLPLVGGTTNLLRRGPAFWDYLVKEGVDAEIYYLPSNFPPKMPDGPGRFRCVSGMGTPDLLGSYGEFTLFTPSTPRKGRLVGGGRFAYLSMLGNRGRAELIGPPNFLRKPDESGRSEPLKAVFDIVRDTENKMAKIETSGTIVLLAEGEWSEWIPVVFQTGIPGSTVLGAAGAPTSIQGMVRLYLKQVHPKFELYVSPINIDPTAPVNQISCPPEFAGSLARRHGRFCTIGIPEDTKALSHGALNEDQFLEQTEIAHHERVAQYREALKDFQSGCMFFYFGTTDLVQHMFWRDRDERHPGRDAVQAERYAQVVEDLYHGTDSLVGDALDALGPGDTLLVMSDHGFNSFRRGFNLNTWLLENGYLRLVNAGLQGQQEMFTNTDWTGTRAYGLGMNGLYVNMAGREKHGTVKSSAKRSLLEEMRDQLMEMRDTDGTAVIKRIDLVDDIYPGADQHLAPDMIVGYNDGYRASWDTVLGKMPRALLEDNLDRWSGTHLICADLVPGMLLTSRKIDVEDPTIIDIAPTILSSFGIAKPAQMTGRSLFSESTDTGETS